MDTKKYALLTDNELLALLRQGDKAGFTEIYNRYWPELMENAFRHLHSVENAKEAVQNVFVSLLLRRQHLHVTTSLKSYLHSAIKYKVLNQIRSNQIRRNYLNTLCFEEENVQETPDKLLAFKELQEKLNLKITTLPNKCREVYIMSREREFSHKDIAAKLDISVSTVEKHIGKALKIIRSGIPV